MRRRLLSGAVLAFVGVATLAVLPHKVSAESFNRSNIIDNAVFDNNNSMSAAQIDAFLNAFPNSCISPKSGFKAIDPTGYSTSPPPSGVFLYGGHVTAGKVIYDAAQAYDLNPQVLIATLEKEQSLVTGRNNYAGYCNNGDQHKYAAAMGYGCPDGGSHYSYTNLDLYQRNGTTIKNVNPTCVNRSVAAGFSQQLIRAAWLLKFGENRSEGNVNWAIVRGSWDNSNDPQSCYGGPMVQGNLSRGPSSCGGGYFDGYKIIDGVSVHLDNGATAALYWYTPHFHGNQLFFDIFTSWFGSTRGSPLFQINGTGTYYLSWSSHYYPIPSTDVLRAYGVSGYRPMNLPSIPDGLIQGPILSRSAKFGSDDSGSPQYTATVSFVDGGKYHNAPNWSTLHNHNINSYTNYDQSLQSLLRSGDPLRPVVRKPNGAIYVLTNGIKHGFPDWKTFAALSGPNYAGVTQVYAQQSITNLSDQYINSLPSGAPMLLAGSYVGDKDGYAIYLYDQGTLHMFSPSTYSSWGKKLDYKFSSTLLSYITKGSNVSNLVKTSGNKYYMADGGRKLQFDTATMSDWGLLSTNFTLVSNNTLSRLSLSGNVGTLIQPRGYAGVYFVSGGQRHGITSLNAFSRLGFSWSNVQTLAIDNLSLVPRGANNVFPAGALVRLPNGAVYMLDDGKKAFGITSMSVFNQYGFSWSRVSNVDNNFLSTYTLSHLQFVIKNADSDEYFVVQNKKKYALTPALQGVAQYNVAGLRVTTLGSRPLNNIKNGGIMSRFIRGSGTTVYYIENGQKHGITRASKLFALGGSWSKVINVSDEFLHDIPSGSII